MAHPCDGHLATCDHCWWCDGPLQICCATLPAEVRRSADCSCQNDALRVAIREEAASTASLAQLVCVEASLRLTVSPAPLAALLPGEAPATPLLTIESEIADEPAT